MTRHPTPAAGVDEFSYEPATGVIDDPHELAAVRGRRRTDHRIAHIEKRLDEAVSDGKVTAKEVAETRVLVGTMSGKLDTALAHLEATSREHHATERARISSTAKTVGAIITALAAIVGAYLAGSGCS